MQLFFTHFKNKAAAYTKFPVLLSMGKLTIYSLVLLVVCSIWFWVKDPSDDPVSGFNWDRDSVYGAAILLGAGGAVVLVISMAMIAYLVGDYTVSLITIFIIVL